MTAPGSVPFQIGPGVRLRAILSWLELPFLLLALCGTSLTAEKRAILAFTWLMLPIVCALWVRAILLIARTSSSA